MAGVIIQTLHQDASCYRSSSLTFITLGTRSVSGRKSHYFFPRTRNISKDRNGYLYPFSDQASAVRDVLEQEVYRLELMYVQESPVLEYRKQMNDFPCRHHRVH